MQRMALLYSKLHTSSVQLEQAAAWSNEVLSLSAMSSNMSNTLVYSKILAPDKLEVLKRILKLVFCKQSDAHSGLSFKEGITFLPP